jgi:hypothetical protein
LIATKTVIWNQGFDKNDAETSLAARPENVPPAMTLVMDYLNMWPDCKIMKIGSQYFCRTCNRACAQVLIYRYYLPLPLFLRLRGPDLKRP